MSFISQTSIPVNDRVIIRNLPYVDSLIVGDWVRLTDMNLLVKAQADNFLNSNVLGLVEELSPTVATVLVSGVSKEIFAGLNVSGNYFLDVNNPGGMYLPPVIDVSSSVVYKLGLAISDKKFLVNLGMRMVRA